MRAKCFYVKLTDLCVKIPMLSWLLFFKKVVMRGVYKIQKPTTKNFAPSIPWSFSTFVHQNQTALIGGGIRERGHFGQIGGGIW